MPCSASDHADAPLHIMNSDDLRLACLFSFVEQDNLVLIVTSYSEAIAHNNQYQFPSDVSFNFYIDTNSRVNFNNIEKKFRSLKKAVVKAQSGLVKSLAIQYKRSRQKLKERIEQLRKENRGLLDRMIAAVKDAWNLVKNFFKNLIDNKETK